MFAISAPVPAITTGRLGNVNVIKCRSLLAVVVSSFSLSSMQLAVSHVVPASTRMRGANEWNSSRSDSRIFLRIHPPKRTESRC